jgi:hypothetical protein
MNTSHKHLVLRAAQLLTLDPEPYLSCDECFARIDEYVEALLEAPDHDDRRMRAHLDACPACAGEAQSLCISSPTITGPLDEPQRSPTEAVRGKAPFESKQGVRGRHRRRRPFSASALRQLTTIRIVCRPLAPLGTGSAMDSS